MHTRCLIATGSAVALLTGSMAAGALDQGDWLVRGRLLYVSPDVDSDPVFVNGAPVAGSSVDVDGGFAIDVDFTYMFTKNVGAELLLDLTSSHDVDVNLGALGVAGQIGEVRALPPSLLLQYHFIPDGKFRPYAGAGVNYTFFFDEDTKGGAASALGATGLDVDDTFGFVLQLGADYDIGNDWFINADVKYIFLDTEADVSVLGGAGVATVDFDLDPWVFGIGVGKRF